MVGLNMFSTLTFDLGICDLSSRLTFWKLDKLEKEKSLVSEHLREEVLSEETAETPVKEAIRGVIYQNQN